MGGHRLRSHAGPDWSEEACRTEADASSGLEIGRLIERGRNALGIGASNPFAQATRRIGAVSAPSPVSKVARQDTINIEVIGFKPGDPVIPTFGGVAPDDWVLKSFQAVSAPPDDIKPLKGAPPPFKDPEPKDGQTPEQNLKMQKDQKEASEAFASDWSEVVSATAAAVAPWAGFRHAGDKAKELGLQGEVGPTAGWDRSGVKDANLDEYGSGQVVGPAQGSNNLPTTVDDVFDEKGQAQGSMKKAQAKDLKEEQEIFKPLREAEKEIKTSLSGFNDQKDKVATCVQDVKLAGNAFEQAKLELKGAQLEAQKAQIERDHVRFTTNVDAATTAIKDAGELTKVIAAPEATSGGIASAAVTPITNALKWGEVNAYLTKIEKVSKEIESIAQSIKGLGVQNAMIGLEKANITLGGEIRHLREKQAEVTDKVNKLKLVYDEMAKGAGKRALAHGASKKEAAQIEAIIRAIPVVTELVTRINDARNQIPDVPKYTEKSGAGFRIAGSPSTFPQAAGQLLAARQELLNQKSKWEPRLASLQAKLGEMSRAG